MLLGKRDGFFGERRKKGGKCSIETVTQNTMQMHEEDDRYYAFGPNDDHRAYIVLGVLFGMCSAFRFAAF